MSYFCTGEKKEDVLLLRHPALVVCFGNFSYHDVAEQPMNLGSCLALQDLANSEPVSGVCLSYAEIVIKETCLAITLLLFGSIELQIARPMVGFIYTFWYSLPSTSSILKLKLQSIHHLQITSSEGFQQQFKIYLLCFLNEKECRGLHLYPSELAFSNHFQFPMLLNQNGISND